MSPLTGEALSTTFTLSASEGWKDTDGDAISFQFSYEVTENNGKTSTFNFAPQNDDKLEVELPTGNVLFCLFVFCGDESHSFTNL